MWRSKALAVLTLSGAVSWAGWAIGAQKLSAQGTLTQPDYTEIQQLYAKYAKPVHDRFAVQFLALREEAA